MSSFSRAFLPLPILVICVYSPVHILAQSPRTPASRQSAAITATSDAIPTSRGLRSTTVTWSTGDGTDGQIYVSRNGEAEVLFAQGPSGSKSAPWIDGKSDYEFRLYSIDRARALLGSVTVLARDPAKLDGTPLARESGNQSVLRNATLNAAPNPVPAGDGMGTTEVSWDVGNGSSGRVMVSVDGAVATLFARGPRGVASAAWIKPGSSYEFTLYNEAVPDVPLASVVVKRKEGDLRTAIVTGLIVVVGFLTLIVLRTLLASPRSHRSSRQTLDN